MPELPEVETTRLGLKAHVEGKRVSHVVMRSRALRLPVPRKLSHLVSGATVRDITRRGKYLILDCGRGSLIIHLGMSGRLWLINGAIAPERHDHFDLVMATGTIIRLRDPRRFGLVLWHKGKGLTHPLLANLGPEPLGTEFDGGWLHRQTRSRSSAIKQTLMDSRVVAGIGNIYANEALFRSGINPKTPAQRIGLARYRRLAEQIRITLMAAIDAGGSSLRDYVGSDGQAGNFQTKFQVYGRDGKPCLRCGTLIRLLRQGQRSTYYCPRCQR
jgi:formamidopyrimidine-DNA glycosylase